jgi:hypothetical protein
LILIADDPLFAGLAKAPAEKRLDEKLMALAKPKLLISNELGYLPLEPNAAHLFLQLVSRRYETGAMLMTSNRSVAECGVAPADPRSSRPRSSTDCSITARCWLSAATATDSAPSAKVASSKRRPPVTLLRSAPPPTAPPPAETVNPGNQPEGRGRSS